MNQLATVNAFGILAAPGILEPPDERIRPAGLKPALCGGGASS